MSFDSIKRKKLTSGLTILGIVIGIAAIISLVSMGQGLESSIAEQLEQFGPDKIMVMSKMVGGLPGTALMGEALEDDDIDLIEKISGVEMAAGVLVKTLSAGYNKKIVTTYVMGLPAEKSDEFFSEIQAFEFEKGRFFEKGEEKVAVLGTLAAHDMFDKDVRIGGRIEIRGERLKVVGILKSIGNAQDDQSIMVPLDTLRDITGNGKDLTMIFVKASDSSRVNSVADKIEDKLDDKYGEDAYMAMTSEQVMETVGAIFAIVSLVLGGIASIALIVAGVGITNTMLMSVMERTREIGIMKAIGATNIKILEIFLIESALLGLIGGFIGCVIGIGISYAITVFAAYSLPVGLKFAIPFWLILVGLGFSVIVGIISGVWPALRAAKLNIVDALRYE